MEPRILLLSKHPSDLEHLQNVFTEEGIFSHCEGQSTSNLKSLLHEHNINVILLDESCFSILPKINSIAQNASVIILLHQHDEDTIKLSMEYKVDHFLLKPRYYNLIPTIYNVLEENS
ncbi:hypothetical protein GCM10007216_36060 [Thalassobacillus devorans]|uniref:Response regulatory domain-containing protein n=1 Tax=Thalassobacillus devorans TaxID=279813 RepID=A0ABQ1PSM1_9BACI|nr:hypothetical protein [Thalassobacillus devorans]NIK30538.1 DNA-binding NarL/FixJ family response regulator [Thalassobacillus devorans]GGD02144.1 hypothetical protein GCM10007216_36060 [Thalassobacillus devorans]